MEPAVARERFRSARVARLATVTPAGRPHVVPVVFAVAGDLVYLTVDGKPKRHRRLQRLANLRANPYASLLADGYDEDWRRLWWVRADGPARVVDGVPEAFAALAARYAQYRTDPPAGPFIVVGPVRWSGWSAAGDG